MFHYLNSFKVLNLSLMKFLLILFNDLFFIMINTKIHDLNNKNI